MTNLITIDEYKVYKEINSETYDSIISLLIGSVSNFIKEYTGRSIIDNSATDKIEYFNAVDNGYYLPIEFPLLNVTEVATSVDGGVTWIALVENTDYFVDKSSEGGEDQLLSNTGLTGFVTSTITFKSGRITYTGGYDTTPADLKLATMDLVHYYRKEEHNLSKSIQSASVTNPVVVIQGNQLPQHIKRVLDLYRVL